ncbi:hypothetical protein [Desulfonatronovibrio hydrogenovorans]|uniref:hypothetical protein n=1 Tax=Desulfonatronovibrio hydrogenovorans TaxID=53245 RepID=UPI0012946E95|nr:hypothetical protein [Desulfonatronovibrio hydrogenovorans]
MNMKVSLGGLKNSAGQDLARRINQSSNSQEESLEEYLRLIRLVQQSFLKKHRITSDKT